MTATKAQALAVALDHCEETGEVTPELVERVVAMFDQLRIVSMTKAGPGDPTTRGRRLDGTQLVSVVRHRMGSAPCDDVPYAFREAIHDVRLNLRSWRLAHDAYEAVLHTSITATHRCDRIWFETHDEAVAWLRVQLRARGWTLLVLR